MKTLITRIFLEQAFQVPIQEEGLLFFERNSPFNEYFLVDFTREADWPVYAERVDATIIPFFKRVAEKAPDIYKNTSLVVCVELSALERAGRLEFRKSSMGIEENPAYFRRYVIPYQESASEGFPEDNIQSEISRKINDPKKFINFSENGFSDPEYHLAMQLATKLPFLSIRWDENGSEFKGPGISKVELDGLMPKPSIEKYIDRVSGRISNLDQLKKLVGDEAQVEFFNALTQYADELDQ